MSLLRKPSTKKIGLKVLVSGKTGVGKSVFALSFPSIVAMDSEAGISLYEGKPLGKNIEFVANTQSVSDMEEIIDEVAELDEIKTLVIDSETKFYETLQQSCLEVEEKRAKRKGGDLSDVALSQRSWGKIKQVNNKMQNLKIDLSAKGVNIVSVTQISDVKTKVGNEFIVTDYKLNSAKGVEYDFDIIINLFTELDSKGEVVYKGEIKKDRTGITKVGQIVENPSYEVWKGHVEERKDGDVIESKLSTSVDKDIKEQENKMLEDEKTVADKLRDTMAKSEEHKAKALELIKGAKIKNPLQPKDAKEIEKLYEIIEEVNKM